MNFSWKRDLGVGRLLAFHFRCSEYWRLGTAAETISLPKPEPGTMRQTRIVPLIGSRDIGLAERSSVRGSEDTLQTLDFPDYLFQVHAEQYSEPPCKNPPLRQVQT